ncbi:hypothetical protein AWJ20_3546 [Sugiyamaella lignohabitans]|uniref:SMP-30/Gluconolactonase/LRE-like region domain-containing protein n=1 Tax=Sugiyamaella lignohabitans TaxID=796027 RepID=A0A167FZF8_9ASCO|nr:uncharacterized protein AWJ20_3546 [Sugiyamaella lignohabitans]ANB15902.1 hypothetical protein AWJ20_3546 [Sugiyamaella lignohabitans]
MTLSNIQIISPIAKVVYPTQPKRGSEKPEWGTSSITCLSGPLDLTTHNNIAEKPFVVFSDDFLEVLGKSPSLRLVAEENSFPFAHEAGVWIPSLREVFFTSNQFFVNPGDKKKSIVISKIKIPESTNAPIEEYKWEVIKPTPTIVGGNGGTNYKDGALICQQGAGDTPGALVHMECSPPYNGKVLINHFHGRPFNAINDVVVLPLDGSIWFTDPSYGVVQGLRERKHLPNQVYSFDPETGDVRVVADGIHMPNGIAFSHDYKVCYITDTQAYDGLGTSVADAAATIYAYDVVLSPYSNRNRKPYILQNKRVFAFADCGAPDGIKVDTEGNVYSGCEDGVQVWNSDGILIGKILVPNGVANFCFTDPGRLVLFNENRIFECHIAATGALVR